jgi:ribosome assembly protein YihI (activator of Der GTPase)
MTRIKKSRGTGQIGLRHKPKAEARLDRERPIEAKKKGSGKKSGSRNSQLEAKSEPNNQGKNAKQDPRIGSKTPIPLVLNEVEKKLMDKPVDFTPKAQLAKAKAPQITPQQELADIEQDEKLMALLERVEQGEILTGKDAKYFNAKTARHAQLMDMLGLSDDADDDFVDDEDDMDPLSKLEKTDWKKQFLGE